MLVLVRNTLGTVGRSEVLYLVSSMYAIFLLRVFAFRSPEVGRCMKPSEVSSGSEEDAEQVLESIVKNNWRMLKG